MIEDLAAQGKSRNEILAEVMRVLGIGEAEAEFMVAVALGEISGDVVELDAAGNEIPADNLT